LKEIHWLAGYLEAEGTFAVPRKGFRSSTVAVSSTDVEPLEKCLKFFGGALHGPYQPRKDGWKKNWRWSANGPRAAGIAMTVYSLLSPRRQKQIQAMLRHVMPEQTFLTRCEPVTVAASLT
jgi:hypothetical protein